MAVQTLNPTSILDVSLRDPLEYVVPSFLKPAELASMASVCRGFQSAVDNYNMSSKVHEEYWRPLLEREFRPFARAEDIPGDFFHKYKEVLTEYKRMTEPMMTWIHINNCLNLRGSSFHNYVCVAFWMIQCSSLLEDYFPGYRETPAYLKILTAHIRIKQIFRDVVLRNLFINIRDPRFLRSKKYILFMLKQNGILLGNLIGRFRNDKEIVLVAVNENGLALQHASAMLKDDEEVVLIAMHSKKEAIQYASARLQANKLKLLWKLKIQKIKEFFIFLVQTLVSLLSWIQQIFISFFTALKRS